MYSPLSRNPSVYCDVVQRTIHHFFIKRHDDLFFCFLVILFLAPIYSEHIYYSHFETLLALHAAAKYESFLTHSHLCKSPKDFVYRIQNCVQYI